ncbi:ATP-binding cassette domain-containing protein [Tissierella sp.]|uniref:ATP-binding cassette domain-containing protein n=1 Tax=Tissierella sp. TaxID=41274 RepID=UPI0028AA6CAF|nr:ATP-binding cassette domain-containing protein [Tissierella sp.]
MSENILKVKDLCISFSQYTKGINIQKITPVESLNIEINKGEILAVVGASGSGKSLLAHAIMGILPRNATIEGEMYYKGRKMSLGLIEKLRGKEIAFIPQSINYLDPLMKVKDQVRIGLPKEKAKNIQEDLFQSYGLEKAHGDLYPFQLSGGMLRRVLFATSVREGVQLVIADEPTPGIHPEVLDTILLQLRKFADSGMAVMLITHDIISALKICDYVTIFKDGENIETSSAEAFEGDGSKLKTEYARLLWRSLPENEFIDMGEFNVTRM